jgi:hypothetical protein
MKARFLAPLAALCLAALSAQAEAVKDREGAVRGDKAKLENDARWIYNDVDRGFAEAKRTGKPLMVVLRCVPCLACMGIDAAVLLDQGDLNPLLDQFVCVRVINANALDLAKFQFDFDLSFTTLFFNADGTVYGRYGSWTHQKNPAEKTTAGLKRALEGALALHGGYPANKPALAGKQGKPIAYKTPVEIPTLSEKYSLDLNWDGKVVQSCVHCHQIGDALRITYRDAKKPVPAQLVYPWPGPETIGLTLAADQAAKVEAVAAGSSAATAGFRAGDEIVSFAGQPLISVADIGWALHHSPDQGAVAAVVKRGGRTQALNLTLPAGWRSKSDISRRVGTWPMRGMAQGGMILEDLSDEERAKRGLTREQMALFVKGVGQYGKHAAAKNAGVQKEDVVIQFANLNQRITEGQLIGQILQTTQIGQRVRITVLRNGQRREFVIPMQ